MIISRLLKPGFYSLIAILLMASQITGCSTEERAEALAGNEILVPEVPTPTPTPTSGIAMFSYSADLSNSQSLSGAVLEQTTVYMFFANTTKYSSMSFYCCKGVGGASKGEGHKTAVRDSAAPFVYSIDLSQYSTSGTRELYVDATRANDNGLDNIFVNFTINITPTPTPTPTPTVSDVSLSWTAPAEREDNQPMSLSDIAGYKVYYGIAQGNYNNSVDINDGTATGHTFKDFTSGTYYFVVTTYDVDGRESQYSTPVQINI